MVESTIDHRDTFLQTGDICYCQKLMYEQRLLKGFVRRGDTSGCAIDLRISVLVGVIKRNDLTKYIKLLTFQWTRFNKAERAKLQVMSGWSLQFDENYLLNRKGQFL